MFVHTTCVLHTCVVFIHDAVYRMKHLIYLKSCMISIRRRLGLNSPDVVTKPLLQQAERSLTSCHFLKWDSAVWLSPTPPEVQDREPHDYYGDSGEFDSKSKLGIRVMEYVLLVTVLVQPSGVST